MIWYAFALLCFSVPGFIAWAYWHITRLEQRMHNTDVSVAALEDEVIGLLPAPSKENL